jgi:hypothetical protein
MTKHITSNLVAFAIISLLFSACGQKKEEPKLNKELEAKMDKAAESYVKLVLQIGKYDPGYIDAYYGPADWKPKEENAKYDSSAIQNLYNETDTLLNNLEVLRNYKAQRIEVLRYTYLYKQILAAKASLVMLAGGKFTFDKEAKALFDADPPTYNTGHFQTIIDSLDKILPGKGSVSERFQNFTKHFIIPKEKLSAVFNAAINEARKRTLEHIKLPQNENFKVEYVTDKPWGGYNWYKGNSYSVIQINTDLPIYIDRAIDLACHEGYPGHHVYNTLLEKDLYKGHGWVEFSVYVLYSPQSLIAEGTANYGIEVCFQGKERIKFETDVLFPLAGLDTSKAAQYYKVLNLVKKLDYGTNEAARNYLDGNWTKEETQKWLEKYTLASKAQAAKRIQFIEKYRSYVINYNYGQDLVKRYIERHGGSDEHPEKRWKLFKELLSTPETPSNLME